MSTTSPILTEPVEVIASALISAPEVRAFCELHQLAGAVTDTVRLLRGAFPANGGVEIALKHDPETTGVSWLAVTIRTQGNTAELVRAFDAFLDQWVPVTPPRVRDRITPTFTRA